MTEATLRVDDSARARVLYMAQELSAKQWRVLFSDGEKRRGGAVEAGDLAALLEQIRRAKERFGLAAQAPVVSCYEAGRDGFWLHRFLVCQGVDNVVVDAASVEQSRRSRRAKTDRLDVEKLLRTLIRWAGGEREAWRVVQVPSEAEEDARRLHRERERLVKERTAHRTRLRSLLALEGLSVSPTRGFVQRLERLRRWDGSALGEELRAELEREYRRLELVSEQVRTLEARQRARIREAASPAEAQVARLVAFRGLGACSAWVLVMEFFAWRAFRNRRQVGGLAGLTGTPHASGDSAREQGVSKAGNRRVRTLAIELAWLWLRYQPDSALSRWYRERFANAGPRARKIGIVALARKLLVTLWRYLDFDEVPRGAVVTAV